MFNSYIDDSGVQDKRVCGMAGFVGSTIQMDRLDKKWKAILTLFDVPEEQGFHSNQFFHHQGFCKDWNDARYRSFLNKLLDAIYQCRVVCIGCMVDVAYFKSLTEDERRWLTGGYKAKQWDSEGSPNSPYFAAFQGAVVGAAKNTPDGEKVTFVFDRQTQHETKARLTYPTMLLSTPDVKDKLSDDIVFSTRLSAVVLQSADLMAYQAYQHVVRRIENGGQYVAPNYVIKQLMRNKWDLKFCNEASVKRLLADFYNRHPEGFKVKRGKKRKQFRVEDKHTL